MLRAAFQKYPNLAPFTTCEPGPFYYLKKTEYLTVVT